MKGTVILFDEAAVIGGLLSQGLVRRGVPVVVSRKKINSAAEEIAAVSPEAVIIIIYSNAEPAVKQIRELKKRFHDVRFITGIFSSLSPDHIGLKNAGVSYSFSVPDDNEKIYDDIMRVLIRDDISAAGAEDFLYRCGFDDKVKGFRYMASAMDICINDIRLLSGGITEVYRRVAELFHTRSASVERDVRSFIGMPQQSGAVSRICFGRTNDLSSSNKEMIAMACDAFITDVRTES